MSFLGGSVFDEVEPLASFRRPMCLGGSVFDEALAASTQQQRCQQAEDARGSFCFRVTGDTDVDVSTAEREMSMWDPFSVQEVRFDVYAAAWRGRWHSGVPAKLLAATLPRMKLCDKLVDLHLLGGQLSGPSVKLLAAAVPDMLALRTLNVCGNEIDDTGASLLATALRQHPSLSKLDLSVNQIHDAGCESLAEAMMGNHSMSVMNLVNNFIGDRGARAFFPVLQRRIQTLRRLYLNGNEMISTQTVQQFCEIEESCDFRWEQERVIWIGFQKNNASCKFSAAGGMAPGVIRNILMFADQHVKVSCSREQRYGHSDTKWFSLSGRESVHTGYSRTTAEW